MTGFDWITKITLLLTWLTSYTCIECKYVKWIGEKHISTILKTITYQVYILETLLKIANYSDQTWLISCIVFCAQMWCIFFRGGLEGGGIEQLVWISNSPRDNIISVHIWWKELVTYVKNGNIEKLTYDFLSILGMFHEKLLWIIIC